MLIIVQTEDGTNTLRNSTGLELEVYEGETLVAQGALDVAHFLDEQYSGNAVLCVE